MILCFKDPSGRAVVQSFWTSHQTQGRIEHFVWLTCTFLLKALRNRVSKTALTVAIFNPDAFTRLHQHSKQYWTFGRDVIGSLIETVDVCVCR